MKERITKHLIRSYNTLLFKELPDMAQVTGPLKDSINSTTNHEDHLYDLKQEFTQTHFQLEHILLDVINALRGVIRNSMVSDLGMKLMKEVEMYEDGMSTLLGKFFEEDKVLEEVKDILIGLSDEACLVGGSVRDTLMMKRPNDFDFVTDTHYDTLKEAFTKAGFVVKETGQQFLVMIVAKGGQDFEIAMYRKDGSYVDGRRPESVEIGDIHDDSMRRDFTCNAMYYRLNDGSLLDPTGNGYDDIDSLTLRFVGKPKERLTEDSLRAFRFYRFVGKGFKPDPKSLTSVRTLLQEESMRIQELQRILNHPKVREAAEEVYKKADGLKDKMVGGYYRPNFTLEELLKPFITLERVRIELEKTVGIK